MGQSKEGGDTTAPSDEWRILDRAEVAESTREEMEVLAATVCDLVLRQPPIQLLGYLLAQFHMVIMLTPAGSEDEPRPNKDAITTFQFALEYVHAVWSSHSPLPTEQTPFDENTAGEFMNALGQLQDKTMWYCMASSKTQTEFHAKSTWAMIRGHRYQVLEEEFFRFVLEPHDAALREAYGIGFVDVAKGIQSISDTFRTGFSQAAGAIKERMDDTYREVEASGESLGAVLERRRADDSSFGSEMSGLFRDLFFGGVCNLSRHSNLPLPLLEDLSYKPGQNSDFFANGPFSGTPMRTLPARIKPGIKLGTDFYATDGQFVRDSAYRAIQWGLWRRLPYRDEWLKRQGRAIEQAYPLILSDQLRGAQTVESVFYKDVQTGRWVETDLLIVLADVLFVIEAKAGVMPMQSPATNFASHERVVQELIVKAYQQCKRFLDYLASAPTVPLYKLIDGDYVEASRLSKNQFRLILPIGLTVEAFTPFSAMAKELPGVEPILGKYPFISMSVDDLFVLRRFLPTTGELLHYLEVRQRVAGLKGALLFDETDHLGAYIAKNRFDMDISEQLKQADQVTWDGFSDKVDHHFEGEAWRTTPPQSQPRPAALVGMLEALDRLRPTNWLRLDSILRSFGHDGPENIARYLDQLIPTLAEHPRRRFQIGENPPLQIWLCRANAMPSAQEVQYQAQVGCLTVDAPEIQVIVLGYSRPGEVGSLRCETFPAPSVLHNNYPTILAEAERQRGRMIKLDQS
ncbi:hypothetical protein ACE10Z_04930 [Bradyrhizobium sp. Pha-3]|uniref:hypothetical protein n=1 Tax=Bradyrhizobium sp. Pha-3 TaxID=208375 RepID=UPI0035D45387